jgi:phosphoribosylanthranilate isomerase
MNIKVCGITQLKQLQQLDGLDIDYAGLIFYKESKRYVGDKINKKDLKQADLDIRKIGVFVDAEYDEIKKTIDEFELDVVQLHGEEDTMLCKKLSKDTEVMKVFRPSKNISVDEMIEGYDEVCDYYLFDSEKGGSGKSFDWEMVGEANIEKPFFLSGGIGPGDVAKIKTFDHPDFFGIDINSKFEKEPGIKDMAEVLKFITALKKK